MNPQQHKGHVWFGGNYIWYLHLQMEKMKIFESRWEIVILMQNFNIGLIITTNLHGN